MKNHYPYFGKQIVIDKSNESFDKSLDSLIRVGAKDNPWQYVIEVAYYALDVACFELVDGSKERALELLAVAKECALAHFRLLLNIDKEVRFTIAGHTFTAMGKPTAYRCDIGDWLYALSLSIILDDWAAIKVLNQFTADHMRPSNLEADLFDEAVLAMMRGFFSSSSEMKALIQEVMIKSDPQFIPLSSRQNYVNKVLLPLGDVYTTAVCKDAQDHFSNAMAYGVDRHRNYWKVSSLKDSPLGWISLMLTAAAIMAKKQNGYVITKASSYVPQWLVDQAFDQPKTIDADLFPGEI